MKSITVFCASSPGFDPVYCDAANALGRLLAERNITLVYGGAKVGLMGKVADGVLQGKGKVIGVLPHFLGGKEIAHAGLSELIRVESMHERKTKMNELCEGVIALPGGFGTLEELFEMLTWAQLGLHGKPIGLLNIAGFYDSLLQLLQQMTDKGLLKEEYRKMLLVDTDAAGLLQQMENYIAPDVPKWITEERT